MDRPLPARILVVEAGEVRAEVEISPGNEVLVGRTPQCHLVLADSTVSRMHARLFVHADGLHLEDLGSANGTQVDGETVAGVVPLHHGQVVQLGQRTRSSPLLLRVVLGGRHGEEPVVATPVPAPEARADEAVPSTDEESLDALLRGVADPPSPLAPTPPADDAGFDVTTMIIPAPLPAAPTEPPHGDAGRRVRRVAAVGLVIALGVLAAWWLGTGFARSPTEAEASASGDLEEAALAGVSLPAAAQATPTAPAAGSDALTATRDLTGTWEGELANVFLPKDDFRVLLSLDLEQDGERLAGSARITFRGESVDLRVPETAVTGRLVTGPSPGIELSLDAPRPVGGLQLAGSWTADGLAGSFTSSLTGGDGAWRAAPAP